MLVREFRRLPWGPHSCRLIQLLPLCLHTCLGILYFGRHLGGASQRRSQSSYLLNHTNIVAIGSDSWSIYNVHRTCRTDLGSEEPPLSIHRRNLVDGGWREEPRALGLQAVQIAEPPLAGQQQGLPLCSA